MSVELTYTDDVRGVTRDDAMRLVGAVVDLHGTTNTSSGTYHAENQALQPARDGDGWRVHVGVSLRDVDKSDYPIVEDDLAETVAGLPVLDVTEADARDALTGSF